MRLFAITALALLAACDPSVPAPDALFMPTTDALCGAEDLSLIGQPESVLAAMTFPRGTRIYRTGDPVTMDFRPDRLNIEIGPDGRIAKVSCG